MVPHKQYLDTRQIIIRDELLLGICGHVARHEHIEAPRRAQGRQPRLVLVLLPHGRIDPQRRAAERQALHVLDKDRLDSLLRGDGADFVLHAVLVLERRQVQPLHLHALEQQLEPARVVGVVVRQHDGLQPVRAHGAELRDGSAAGVDVIVAAAAVDEGGVAL